MNGSALSTTLVISLLAAGILSAAPAPVEPLELNPLPTGAIRPEGWLKVQLEQMTEGLCGHLHERSSFLAPDNGWLKADGNGGWEEQPYWFRGFVKIAILTGNERMLGVSRDWVEKILATQDADGWYGPAGRKAHPCKSGKVISDIWGHMVMNEALLSWYRYTGDRRVLDLLVRFYRCLAAMDETRLLPGDADRAGSGSWTYDIQVVRAGDAVPAILECHGLTGEPWLPALAARVWRHRARPGLFANNHNVNFAQLVGYGTVMSRLTRRRADRESAAFWFDLHMKAWGATPRCGFAADENVRPGCTDPRYGTETCAWAELIRSFALVGEVTGETVWGDRMEDVMYNWYPIAFTPGWKELHYITAGNQVNLDAVTDHNYENGPPMIAYSDVCYRCCRHNAHFGVPLFCESLVMRPRTGGLAFWLYAPHRGEAELADGAKAAWRMETDYPFREKARLTLSGAAVPALRFRVPGWCRRFAVSEGGRTLAAATAPGGWLEVKEVRAGATLELAMAAECAWREYPRHGGLSLERGPLTYSIALEPKVERVRRPKFVSAGGKLYPEPEESDRRTDVDMMVAMTPKDGQRWNYAIDRSSAPAYRELPLCGDCFRFAAAPAEIRVKGRPLAEWTLQDNQPAPLQDSPALTTAPAEDLRFIPMCCARLHVTVFPEATADAALGNRWRTVPATTLRKNRPKRMPRF